MNEVQITESFTRKHRWIGSESVEVASEGNVITVYLNEWWADWGVAKEIVLSEEQIKQN